MNQTLSRLVSEYHHLEQQVVDEQKALDEARLQVQHTQQAQTIVQNVAQQVQHQAHQQIAGVVTQCLQAVFGDEAPAFKINFVRKRGRTEAELVFVYDNREENPKDGGCGLVDVAAFALRLVCLRLVKPKLQPVLFMDEPMKWLNGWAYQERMGQLLLTLAQDMGVQMVLVSDDNWLRVGRVIDLEE